MNTKLTQKKCIVTEDVHKEILPLSKLAEIKNSDIGQLKEITSGIWYFRL
jgi:hypothetical protein